MKKKKRRKPVNLDEYRNTKEFTDSIESGSLYDELKPKRIEVDKLESDSGVKNTGERNMQYAFDSDFKATEEFLLEASDLLKSHNYKINGSLIFDDVEDILDHTEELKSKLSDLLYKVNALDQIARAIQIREISKFQ